MDMQLGIYISVISGTNLLLNRKPLLLVKHDMFPCFNELFNTSMNKWHTLNKYYHWLYVSDIVSISYRYYTVETIDGYVIYNTIFNIHINTKKVNVFERIF